VKRGGPQGLLSIVGGKLTTYRSLARAAASAIEKRAAPSGVPVQRGGAPAPLSISGARARAVQALIDADRTLGEPICAHNPETMAQVAYAVDGELAATLADVLLRRLPAGWSACGVLDGVERVAAYIGSSHGWTSERIAAEVAAYERERRATLVSVRDLKP